MKLVNSLEALNSYDNLLLPDYDKNCIVNIPSHIKYLHGIQGHSVLATEEKRLDINKTVLFTIDGFGYKQWHEHQEDSKMLTKIAENGSVTAVTSMFPSSTAPSITGLSTGLTTQQHGLIEWTMYEQISDQIITTLPFTGIGEAKRDSLVGKVDPSVLMSSPTLYQDLSNNGVKSYTLISDQYASSTYSSLSYAGSTIVPFANLEDLFLKLKDILLKDERLHVNAYWDKIDSAGHAYSPDSKEYALEVARFFEALDNFSKSTELSAEAAEVQILMTADHGQIAVEPQNTIWLDELPFLVGSLDHGKNGEKILPWGLQRDVYLKVIDDKLDETISRLTTVLQGSAVVLKSADALESGLFGKGELHPDFKVRIGNLMTIPRSNNTIWYKHFEGEDFKYKGMHGGLTSDEVQIAFAECSLDKLTNG